MAPGSCRAARYNGRVLPLPVLTFQPSDILTVGSLVILEGLLSADNALVLALLVQPLRKKDQDRALWYGLVMAFTLRAIGIALASILIGLWWVCALGSLYLIFLTVKHFLSKRSASQNAVPPEEDDADEVKGSAQEKSRRASFWLTVGQVGLTDLFFAIDSILVAVALVHAPAKIWIVYLGGLIGIVLLRIAAQALISLIHRYPLLDNLAYLLVGWAGVKLGFTAAHLYGQRYGVPLPEMPKWIFWSVFAVIIVGGVWHALRHGPRPAPLPDSDEPLE